MLAPIVLFAYNRPGHLLRVINSLAENPLARDSELWVFSDGPRDDSMRERVQLVRQTIESAVDRKIFANVKVQAATHNIGLANSVIRGVGEVLESYGRAIVLEDDLILAPDALDFMNQALEFYESDPSIGSVTAFSPLSELPIGYPHSVYRMQRNCSHGWGTWLDRWREVDWNADGYGEVLRDWRLRSEFDRCGNDRSGRLRRQMLGHIDSWSIRFGYWQFRTGSSTIYPVDNRIQNIGYDGSGVHCGVGTAKNERISRQASEFTLEQVGEEPRIVKSFYRVYSGDLLERTLRRWRYRLQTLVG